MIFGDVQRFAIRHELNPNYGGFWLFGKACCWVGGRQIGDYELGTAFVQVLPFWDRVSQDRGKRRNDWLMSLSTEDLLRTVYLGMYDEGDNPELVNRAIEEQWACHDVLPPLDIFRDWLALLIEDDHVGRLVLRNRVDETSTEFLLHPDEFDQVLADALAPLYDLNERETQKSGH